MRQQRRAGGVEHVFAAENLRRTPGGGAAINWCGETAAAGPLFGQTIGKRAAYRFLTFVRLITRFASGAIEVRVDPIAELMTDKPKDSGGSPNERLIEQARSAADQAIELAKLAQESAKLARDLNRRAMGETGQQLENVPEVTISNQGGAAAPQARDEFSNIPAPHVPAPAFPQSGSGDQRPPKKPKPKRKRNSRDALKQKVEQARKKKVEGVNPRRVRIKTQKGDLDREEGVVPFLKQNWNSMTISGVVITLGLSLLTFWIMPVVAQDRINTVLASFSDVEAVVEEDIPVEEPDEEEGEQTEEEVEEPEPEPEEPEPEPEPEMAEEPPAVEETPVETPESTEPPIAEAPPVDFSKVGTRSDSAKKALLQKYGGSAASESAVGNALEWLAKQQQPDGSWRFNRVGQSGGAGTVENPMAGTGYVLLTFLGAGQTHLTGKYKKNVEAGLNFLMKWRRPVGNVIDFSGVSGKDKDTHERFYSHGAATMALSEAYSMTKARKLKPLVQGGVNALILAQDPNGGGWEYVPQAPGTTSVTGLQVTALFSAKKGGVKIPNKTLALASRFFDSVQSDENGARYGYTASKPSYKSSVTAIAILCRQYLGWKRDDPVHKRAIKLLDDKGPASASLYYLYYATQAMRNYGGPEWERWNEYNREDLCRRQETDGPAAGSWPTRNRAIEAKAGGRMFMTCLATLTLEVYYRYMPLYDELSGGESDDTKDKKSKSRRKSKK